jgi:hypothetical protein
VSGRPVPWSLLLFYEGSTPKFSSEWLTTPTNVTTSFRDGTNWCRLCDSRFAGETPAAHVAGHAVELDAWLEQRRRGGADRPEKARQLRAQETPVVTIAKLLDVSPRQVRRYLEEP